MPDATTDTTPRPKVDPIKIAYGEQMVDAVLAWHSSMLNVLSDPMGIAEPTTTLMNLANEVRDKLQERDG
jgi:hypothetical protein